MKIEVFFCLEIEPLSLMVSLKIPYHLTFSAEMSFHSLYVCLCIYLGVMDEWRVRTLQTGIS